MNEYGVSWIMSYETVKAHLSRHFVWRIGKPNGHKYPPIQLPLFARGWTWSNAAHPHLSKAPPHTPKASSLKEFNCLTYSKYIFFPENNHFFAQKKAKVSLHNCRNCCNCVDTCPSPFKGLLENVLLPTFWGRFIRFSHT